MRDVVQMLIAVIVLFLAILFVTAYGHAQPQKMTLPEWRAAYDDCVRKMGIPVVMASREPGLSLGVGCAEPMED